MLRFRSRRNPMLRFLLALWLFVSPAQADDRVTSPRRSL